MWTKGWRERVWSQLDQHWDLIVIGGGITGAGIFREAAKSGLKVLLVEQNDFAAGTSSRSSKLVHGGLRYLKNAQVKLTYESVHEREHLLRDGRGLVSPLGFLLVNYQGDRPPAWVFGAGLILYDILAKKWSHRYYDSFDILELCPTLKEEQLRGGYRFFDAQTDDARLVLRVLREGVQAGGYALNYSAVTRLLKTSDQRVCGIVLEDRAGQGLPQMEIKAKVVINATGAWADVLRQAAGGAARLRKLRGSHLIFSQARLPLARAVSVLHPRDHRPVFIFPWEGITLVGTTDMDHPDDLNAEPHISAGEFVYLLQAVQALFPRLELTSADVQGTFAGVRPVIDSGKQDPSKESREYVLWEDNGLITVSGGKLTTFRLMAHSALKRAIRQLGKHTPRPLDEHILDPLPSGELLAKDFSDAGLPANTRLRILGRYGCEAHALLDAAVPGLLTPVGGTPSLWAELLWAAHAEGVVHLSDLLMRRTRLGLTLPQGGLPLMDQIRSLTTAELDWTDAYWQAEIDAYSNLWHAHYNASQNHIDRTSVQDERVGIESLQEHVA